MIACSCVGKVTVVISKQGHIIVRRFCAYQSSQTADVDQSVGSHIVHAFIQAIETVALSCFISGAPIGKHAYRRQAFHFSDGARP